MTLAASCLCVLFRVIHGLLTTDSWPVMQLVASLMLADGAPTAVAAGPRALGPARPQAQHPCPQARRHPPAGPSRPGGPCQLSGCLSDQCHQGPPPPWAALSSQR